MSRLCPAAVSGLFPAAVFGHFPAAVSGAVVFLSIGHLFVLATRERRRSSTAHLSYASCRRADVDDFFDSCDPDKENLCLYGHPDGTWEVSLPAEEVPPELPEPALCITFARNSMNRRDWLSLVAVHSDLWLLFVAFFFGAPLSANEL
ncbi:PHD finger protein ALFIN-LIKE 2-like [Hordeum vulgare subsp. vulgare]|uniref:PHD finger protein ALFIN-LIKE 2-like n=1 Tax=Hordeum vulgare subsp. vulgare TaxID=112509 RepID=UPI001D1A41FA|nr:PHD finger protein ALFIN-LIKE 2-like [Hordeum vulgare subsp. vulgare]